MIQKCAATFCAWRCAWPLRHRAVKQARGGGIACVIGLCLTCLLFVLPSPCLGAALSDPLPPPSVLLSSSEYSSEHSSEHSPEHSPEHSAEPEGGKGIIPGELGLEKTVALALTHSRRLINARLNRTLQRYSLKVAEARYLPVGNVGLGNSYNDEQTLDSNVSTNVSLRIPTGGRFSFGWNSSRNEPGNSSDEPAAYDTGFNITFSQPLLRDAGFKVDRSAVEFARISEQNNILAFRSTVIGIITEVVYAWRSYSQQVRQLEITERSLERSRETLRIYSLMVQTGRMPASDLVQTEAELANRELDLIQARNGLDTARLQLLNLLDVESAEFGAAEAARDYPEAPTIAQSLELAFANRTDYQQTLNNIDSLELSLLLQQNQQRPNLRLTASMNYRGEREDNAFATSFSSSLDDLVRTYILGLSLDVPLWDRDRRRSLLSAELSLRQAMNDLQDLRQSIDIEVRNAVRNVETGQRRVELAKTARELSERTLTVERKKMQNGLSNAFQVRTYEDNLVSAQNAEVDAQVNYLNSLTQLDQTLGTTLETWGVDLVVLDSEGSQ